MTADQHLEQGQAAIDEGRWDEARAAFEASLAQGETPEAQEGLGRTLWWLCDARGSAQHRERAFVLFRREGRHTSACAVAVDLVITYLLNLGNQPAAAGWLARAERVAEHLEPNPMEGWLRLMQAFTTPDGARARELLELAIGSAREAGDADLELVALADLGLLEVTSGEVARGMALLDEAMAGSMAGEGGRQEVVVYNCCSMLAACHVAGDVERAAQWCRVADEFMRRHSSPFLFARCRVHYGSLLFTKGRWDEAETELRAALAIAEDAGPGPRAAALTTLAELRIRQGRLEEADELLAGCEADPAPRLQAAVLVARDQAAAAVALLERRLADSIETPAERARALAALVDANLARGHVKPAARAAARLDELVDDHGEAAALAALASGRVALACEDLEEAIARLEDAGQQFTALGLPFEGACARLDQAGALASRQSPLASTVTRAALREFEQLGATAYADRAASLLRSLGERAGSGSPTADALTRREQDVLRLVALGLSNPEIAERLYISRKTAAHHVSSILMKLGLTKRGQLIAYAVRSGAGAGSEAGA